MIIARKHVKQWSINNQLYMSAYYIHVQATCVLGDCPVPMYVVASMHDRHAFKTRPTSGISPSQQPIYNDPAPSLLVIVIWLGCAKKTTTKTDHTQ